MNILFVSALLPYPLHSGGQVRIYNLLKLLSKKHTITLASFIRNRLEEQYIKELHFCKQVIPVYRGRVWQPGYLVRTLFSSQPLLYVSYDIREMKEVLSGILHSGAINVIHLEPSYVWPALPDTTVPVVVSEHNIEYHVYEQYASAFAIPAIRPLLSIDVAKHKQWETHIWRKASFVTAVSEGEADVIRGYAPKTRVAVVPNGVDTDSFTFRIRDGIPKNPLCLFVGNFYWIENRDALYHLVRNIWPAVKADVPEARLRIVGKNIPDSLRRRIENLHIEYQETADDIRQVYTEADILIAPIRIGGGTKFKIIEAMASGLPVITTAKGTEGMSVKNEHHILIAETSEEFSQAAQLLIRDKKLVTKIQRNARNIIEREFSWKIIADKLDAVWRSA